VDVSFSIGESFFRDKLDQLVLSKHPRIALAFFGFITFVSFVALVTGAFILNGNAVGLLEQLSFGVHAIEALKKVTEIIICVGTLSFSSWMILVIHSVTRKIGGGVS
jgi:hypothetical protein